MNAPQLLWNDVIFFSDVDDTLITTALSTPLASSGIKDLFSKRFNEEVGAKVQKEFNTIFQTMISGHTGKNLNEEYANLIKEIKDLESDLKEQWGKYKLWSREIFILIAASRVGITITSELLYEATDSYWLTLSKVANPFPGVIEFIKEITKHQRPLYLLTSSDARLKLKANNQFEYNPPYSEAFKRERMQLLREKQIVFNLVSIGDPEDKPDSDFFEKGISLAESDLSIKIEMKNAVMIGDSYEADLRTPKEHLGFGLVVLYEHGREKIEIVDEHYIKVGNLQDIVKFLK